MTTRNPSEQRERAMRMVHERIDDYPSVWAAAQAYGSGLGIGSETLRKWVVQAPRPNHAWVTDFAYVALAIDPCSRAIGDWSTSTRKDTAFVETCLKMAPWRRDHSGRPVLPGMIHHIDAVAPYNSIRFRNRCLDGLSSSIGTVGDAYEDAPAETMFGLFKNGAAATGPPFRTGPLRHLDDVKALTINNVHWYKGERLHGELTT